MQFGIKIGKYMYFTTVSLLLYIDLLVLLGKAGLRCWNTLYGRDDLYALDEVHLNNCGRAVLGQDNRPKSLLTPKNSAHFTGQEHRKWKRPQVKTERRREKRSP